MSPIGSASNRKVILGLLVGLLFYLSVRYGMNPTYVSDPLADAPARTAELMDRIDPNTADAATLAALPTIGPNRAAQIVAYRDGFRAMHPDRRAFAIAADLTHVEGIGDVTVKLLEPYLMFPARP